MANLRLCNLMFFILFASILAVYAVQGARLEVLLPNYPSASPAEKESDFQGSREADLKRNSRRLMIGSTAPTCSYNECRGCKYKCRAEQVPVEGNDPINSPYHYKCVCHR
ncbi:EPIDERMAL PATTERNING FACTOR-like protein 9 [Tripterygium wilfordii]|uniref:EPIDERMAL PATTERNING FACTOR-like protein 9 n=1 Tax=Tripterygium wilfordii TaxID=458696 RepID=A0A7J7DJL4_TRIWF|nr:EPIDERMAL PATTERNING FACTOR-like protein 9 [Tripterygium wilfordii]KAF5746256.1 EPIDERMAL PATTERNING FACTOR-like protein 9 [Tripterygium wilfordii]